MFPGHQIGVPPGIGIANRDNDLRDGAGGCKGLRPVAKTLILTAVSGGITVDTAAV